MARVHDLNTQPARTAATQAHTMVAIGRPSALVGVGLLILYPMVGVRSALVWSECGTSCAMDPTAGRALALSAVVFVMIAISTAVNGWVALSSWHLQSKVHDPVLRRSLQRCHNRNGTVAGFGLPCLLVVVPWSISAIA